MQENQFEGALPCQRHQVRGCVPCAEKSALTRDLPSVGLDEWRGNRTQRRAQAAQDRKQNHAQTNQDRLR